MVGNVAGIFVVGEVSGLYLVGCPYLGQVEGNIGCSYPTHPGSHGECANCCLPEKRGVGVGQSSLLRGINRWG